MASGSVTTTGLSEMRASIDRLPAAVEAAARRVARDTANRVADNARRGVRVRTGALKGTIAVHEDSANRQYRVSVGDLSGPPIAVFVEYGTVHMDAQPFFGPALEIGGRTYQRDLEAATAAAAKG